MAIILGIDPGSRITGFGLINANGQHIEYISSGCIRLGEGEMEYRLNALFENLSELIEQHSPQQFAIERAFMGRNADSALKLGQARGVAMVAATQKGLAVSEYSPKAIKQSVAGVGSAEKAQIQLMVQKLLKLPGLPQADAADALAVALCHHYHESHLIHTLGTSRKRRGRLS